MKMLDADKANRSKNGRFIAVVGTFNNRLKINGRSKKPFQFWLAVIWPVSLASRNQKNNFSNIAFIANIIQSRQNPKAFFLNAESRNF
ncbi:hypothetical protein BpHYR1_006822 [Brachionus plicatilis]|uniref:Uncharacterized protein n=1 Tax=Brachionus plicatilis TaxID=10195 RepID=A0A3M7SBG0_BRAPC|nr:hypothetical protein BpHYR1_006822 [Brachionus plicatilis]